MKQRSLCGLSYWLFITAIACTSSSGDEDIENPDDVSDDAAQGGSRGAGAGGGVARGGGGGNNQAGGAGGNRSGGTAGSMGGRGGSTGSAGAQAGKGGGGNAGSGGGGSGGGGGIGADVEIEIQPLGDSITQGTQNEEDYTYRRPLWMKLKQAGYKVNFVGSTNKQFPEVDHLLKDYDHDHEGHWGKTIGDVLSQLETWIQGYTADVSLIHLGTNDQRSMNGQPAWSNSEEMLANMEKIIKILRARNPRITIVLAQLILPETEGVKFNAALPAFAARLSTAASPIIVVNQAEGFTKADTFDADIHPNGVGAEKMASKFFAALEQILPRPAATQ